MNAIKEFNKEINANLTEGMPHPVDLHVGRMLRTERKRQGFSQSALAEAMDKLTFQQVQKYERGANRLSASKIWEASRFLKVSPAFFFEGLPVEDGMDGMEKAASIRDAIAALGDFPALEKVSSLTSEQRHALVVMIEGFAKANA